MCSCIYACPGTQVHVQAHMCGQQIPMDIISQVIVPFFLFFFFLEGPMSPIDLEPIKWARMPGPGALGTGLSLLPNAGPVTTHHPPSFSNVGSGD